jgi:hypothetical protein
MSPKSGSFFFSRSTASSSALKPFNRLNSR